MIKRHRFLLGILALALLPRLIHLDSRPLGPHAWRQCDTASVARNFHQNGYRLSAPQIDWAVPGFVEMEFPLFPWVTSLGDAAVGEAEWRARLRAIAGYSCALYIGVYCDMMLRYVSLGRFLAIHPITAFVPLTPDGMTK